MELGGGGGWRASGHVFIHLLHHIFTPIIIQFTRFHAFFFETVSFPLPPNTNLNFNEHFQRRSIAGTCRKCSDGTFLAHPPEPSVLRSLLTDKKSSFVGAIAIGDLVKSTLGPKGMDKILQSISTQDILVTNDGATILKSIALDNPAAKVLVNISKVQDDEVGDGTTSVCVLASELLKEAEKLVNQKVHPQIIIDGYRIASGVARQALEEAAQDHSSNEKQFREDLLNIARTTLSSKVLSIDKDYFSKLAVDAVLRLKGSTNLEHIQIIKKPGGRLVDSYLDEGFILDKKIGVNQPKRIENAKILIANTRMFFWGD
jgi:chaperonin GroEL (HSP60 family)